MRGLFAAGSTEDGALPSRVHADNNPQITQIITFRINRLLITISHPPTLDFALSNPLFIDFLLFIILGRMSREVIGNKQRSPPYALAIPHIYMQCQMP
jgi:hypothetical protein